MPQLPTACSSRRKCKPCSSTWCRRYNFSLHSIAENLCCTTHDLFLICSAIAVRLQRVHSEKIRHVHDVSRNARQSAALKIQLPTVPFFSGSRPSPRFLFSICSAPNRQVAVNTHHKKSFSSSGIESSLLLSRSASALFDCTTNRKSTENVVMFSKVEENRFASSVLQCHVRHGLSLRLTY